MFDGLDEVDWAGLDVEQDGDPPIPVMVRQAMQGGEATKHALSALWRRLMPESAVMPAAPAAVPFLIELALSAPTLREGFVWLLGELADTDPVTSREVAGVRAALSVRVGVFVALLDDPDPGMRAAATLVLARCGGPAGELRGRWEAERDPDVRAGLVLALGCLESERSVGLLVAALADSEPLVRMAAAVALVRAGVDWPEGTIPGLVTAVDANVFREPCWSRLGGYDELFAATGDEVAYALLAALMSSEVDETRETAIRGVVARMERRRTGADRLLRLLAPMLRDPDRSVRLTAVQALRSCGAAVGEFADEVAAVVPDRVSWDDDLMGRYQWGVETLMLLGDPRWVDLACVEVPPECEVGTRGFLSGMPCTPQVVAAVLRRLGRLCALGRRDPMVGVLAETLAGWNVRDPSVISRLVEALPYAGEKVSLALLCLGYRGEVVLPYLRALVTRKRDVEAALGIWRVVGDVQPLLDVVAPLLADGASVPEPVWGIDEVGEALLPLVPLAVTGLSAPARSAMTQFAQSKAMCVSVFAARLLWAATGDPTPGFPALDAALSGGGIPAGRAADLLADIADRAGGDGARSFLPALRTLLADPEVQVRAARALWRIGVSRSELVGSLLSAIEAGWDPDGAISLLVEMEATEAVTALENLAERDERIISWVGDNNIVWQDERLQRQLREAVTVLRAVEIQR